MSASTSSLEAAQVLDSRRRVKSREPGWQNPVVPGLPTGSISDRLGPKLEREFLIEIADSFLVFDLTSLSVCQTVFENILAGRLNVNDSTAPTKAKSSLQEIATIQEELLLIQSGQLQFHQNVLKNQVLIEYTGKNLSLLSQMLADPSMNESVRSTFDRMLRQILDVPETIKKAALDGSLDSETRVALRRRWIRINEMSEYMESKALLALDKVVPSWAEIANSISPAIPNINKERTKGVLNNRIQWINTILWATFTSNVCLTIPFLWKAYQFSSHTPGTLEDSDFWFQVQSCVSQMVGLLISAIAMWRKPSVSAWAWLPPTVIAALSNLLAIPLYLVIPTEWSSFLIVVAAAIQSFMVLQLAIAGE